MSDNIFVDYNRNILESRFVLNNIVKFGHYKQSRNSNDWKTEPIEWIVIDRDDNKALLLSQKGLDCHQYNCEYSSCSWTNSELRRWLNNEFINEAFANNKETFVVTKIEDSNDYFFILDEDEIDDYLGTSIRYHRLEGSDYCKLKSGYGWSCPWWTRTRSRFSWAQGSVTFEGRYYKSDDVKSEDIAVRPAIWIDIYNDVFLTKEEKEETAQRLFDQKDYVNAEKCFQKLNNSEKVKLCKYFQAKKLLDEGSFVDAYNIYLTISDYQDVSKILKENEKLVSLRNLIDKCSVGNTIKFGKYYKNNSNQKEPIEWIVLEQDIDNTVLVIAKNALDCRIFDNKKEDVLWSNSEICNFLNNEFYKEAFSEKEQECIWSLEVINDICTRFNSNKEESNETTINNNVFLLSVDEVNHYFPEILKRKCKTTEYCEQSGAFIEYDKCCWWWLRNQGYESNKASYVDNNGQIIENGANVSCNDICVRPAIWIGFQNIMDSLNGNIEVCNNEVNNILAFETYLYSAYLNKIPLILFGNNSMQIAKDFANTVDNNSFILDCNNSIEIDSTQKVVIIDNLIESENFDEIAELLEKRERFYLIVIPENVDLLFFNHSFYNYALPVFLDNIIDDYNTNYNINTEKIKEYLYYKPNPNNKYETSNQIKEMLNNLGVSKLIQWFYHKLLTDAHSINNQLSDKDDLLLMLLSYAYVINRTEVFKKL